MNVLEAIRHSLVFLLLIAASGTDIRQRRIPNWLTGIGWVLGILFFMAEWSLRGKEAGISQCMHLVGVAALVLGLALFAAISHHGFGFGDVKLLGTAVLYQGIEKSLAGFLVGIILAGGAAAVLLMLGRIGHRDKLPLAPFFLLGYGAVLLGRSCGIAV